MLAILIKHFLIESKPAKQPTASKKSKEQSHTSKIFTKEVIERGDESYRNFDPNLAQQTTDIIGKHIYEFRQSADSASREDVPEIFVLLIAHFEMYPE